MINLLDKDLSFFVSGKTLNVFKRFNISLAFLQLDPKNWETNKGYSEAINFVNEMHVVNDTAERGVKLMEKYQYILTKNEAENQFILQVVSYYTLRCILPSRRGI